MILCVAIHGILTGQTRASWPDRLDAWMAERDPEIRILKKEYRAGPLPIWNCVFKNPRLAQSIVEEVELFVAGTTHKTPIWFVAHSNGAVIALNAVKRLIARGIRVDGIILTGAACESDVTRNGVLQWVNDGWLGRAISYSSPEDGVLNMGGLMRYLKWPYGDLGRRGWTRNAGWFWTPGVIRTVWFCGGHCIYFAPGYINDTFERIHEEIRKGSNF